MQGEEERRRDSCSSKPQKAKRRTRNDLENRNFLCGCGKRYLSYPALYTHLKQKHDGKPPMGTALPNTLSGKTVQGKIVVSYSFRFIYQHELEAHNQGNDDLDRSFSSIEPEERIEELVCFLGQIKSSFRAVLLFPQPSGKGKHPEPVVFDFLDSMFQPSEYQKILDLFKEISSSKVENENDVDESDGEDPTTGIKNTNINKIFAHFLAEIQPQVSEQVFREVGCPTLPYHNKLTIYIILYAKSLNQLGSQAAVAFEKQLTEIGHAGSSVQLEPKVQDIQKQVESSQKMSHEPIKTGVQQASSPVEEFCEKKCGDYILLIANEFILKLLPSHFSKFGEEVEAKMQLIGGSEDKLKNAVYIMQHFSQWLYAKKYTNSRLGLYTDDD